jgi:hypothetical protein
MKLKLKKRGQKKKKNIRKTTTAITRIQYKHSNKLLAVRVQP